jgi:hypothetical protein
VQPKTDLSQNNRGYLEVEFKDAAANYGIEIKVPHHD